MKTIAVAVKLDARRLYFFHGNTYVRYDMGTDRAVEGYPFKISGNWPGLWSQNIDAAVNWGNGKVYFFKGDEYIRYDIALDKSDPGYPKKIKDNWPGLWNADLNSVVNWDNGKVYFFKGDEYIRYDIASDKSDPGYPKKIKDNWPGLWHRDIDGAFSWNSDIAYFFKNHEYIRYDKIADRAVSGYPSLIYKNWPGSLLYTPNGQVSYLMYNASEYPVYVKPENSNKAEMVRPHSTYEGKIDGVSSWNQRQGKVVKTIDFTSVTVEENGKVTGIIPIIRLFHHFDAVNGVYGINTQPDAGWKDLFDEAKVITVRLEQEEREETREREERVQRQREYNERLERYETGERQPGERPRRRDEMNDPF